MGQSDTASDNDKLIGKFRRLNDLVASCEKRANRSGERFNIFSILNIQREEARTHSRFLAELLRPNGRHGEGSRFLNLFVAGVLRLTHPPSGRINVTRELATEDRRRVDIVIEAENLIIGIEVKIDAADQKAQLQDYYRELTRRASNRKTAVLVYLTLDGKAPSGYSLSGLELENVHCVSFSGDIRQWLDQCVQLITHKPELYYSLIQYKQLIENLTGAGASMTALLADSLVRHPGDMETALTVEKALPGAKAMVMLRFWEDLYSALTSALGEAPVIYGGKNLREISTNYYDKTRGGKHVGVKYVCGTLNGERICLYVNVFNAIHYGLRIEDVAGCVVSKPEVKAKLREKVHDGNAVADKHSDWLVCYYHSPLPDRELVVLNFDSFNDSVIRLLDEDERYVIIQNMVDHQISLLNAARSLIDVG